MGVPLPLAVGDGMGASVGALMGYVLGTCVGTVGSSLFRASMFELVIS